MKTNYRAGIIAGLMAASVAVAPNALADENSDPAQGTNDPIIPISAPDDGGTDDTDEATNPGEGAGDDDANDEGDTEGTGSDETGEKDGDGEAKDPEGGDGEGKPDKSSELDLSSDLDIDEKTKKIIGGVVGGAAILALLAGAANFINSQNLPFKLPF